ncbi:hypothetical protein CROQUDRAFT_108987, partial [Cronartium quercuum f. sp. fusiforme G11]
ALAVLQAIILPTVLYRRTNEDLSGECNGVEGDHNKFNKWEWTCYFRAEHAFLVQEAVYWFKRRKRKDHEGVEQHVPRRCKTDKLTLKRISHGAWETGKH